MRQFVIAFLLVCLFIPAQAQEEFVPPEATLITRFPFTQISGGIVIVKAQFDDFPDSPRARGGAGA